MQEAALTSSIPVTNVDLSTFYSLVPTFRKIVSDIVMFKLVCIIILTKHDNELNSLSRLHSHASLLLQRRLEWSKQFKGLAYSDIMNCLNDLPKLADTLAKIIKE